MNKKYVYLFELDSARKTDAEIVIGQQTLYNEIVKNGYTNGTRSNAEGIEKIIAVTQEELEILLSKGKISDGFTLSAYTLYTHYKLKRKGQKK